jgi:hypothetical protein
LVLWSLVLLTWGLLGAGCARLAVESDPSGADVLWSPNGLSPWRAWPPQHWAIGEPDTGTTPTTPLRDSGPAGEYLFVTVDKPGYYRPRPRLAGLRRFRTVPLEFELKETPEHFADRQLAAGLVPYRGEWVAPEAFGLVEYQGEWMPEAERVARINREKGLVEFEGKWVTRETYESLYAERQRERGLVEYKSRWVTPSQRATEEAIDRAVKQVIESSPPEVVPPRVLGRIEGSLAQLGLISASPRATRWLVSGPVSRGIDLPPGGSVAPEDFRLIPGRYTLAIFELGETEGKGDTASVHPSPEGEARIWLPANPRALPGLSVLIEQPLSPGFQYSLTYTSPSVGD